MVWVHPGWTFADVDEKMDGLVGMNFEFVDATAIAGDDGEQRSGRTANTATTGMRSCAAAHGRGMLGIRNVGDSREVQWGIAWFYTSDEDMAHLAVTEVVHPVEDLRREALREQVLEAAVLADLGDERDALAKDVREEDDGDEEEDGKRRPERVRHDVAVADGGDRRHRPVPAASR